MAPDKWSEVDKAFERFEQFRSLHPTLAAMKRVLDLIKPHAAFADLHPSVSMATLVLTREHIKREVCVAWLEDNRYNVYFADFSPSMNISEHTTVSEGDVIQTLLEYLEKLGREAS